MSPTGHPTDRTAQTGGRQAGTSRNRLERRRSTTPLESPFVFCPRFAFELVYKHVRHAAQIVRFGRFGYQLKRDPEAKNYCGIALTPVIEENTSTLELPRVLNNPKTEPRGLLVS